MDYSAFMPVIMSVVGSALSAKGSIDSGNAAMTQANYEASQMRVNAGQAQAASQSAAVDSIRQAQVNQSRALAIAAASGGGALDPTVMHIIGGLSGEGALAAATHLYNGDETARAWNDKANATVYSGQLAQQAAKTKAMASVLNGAKSIYDNVNWGGGGGQAGYSASSFTGSGTGTNGYVAGSYTGSSTSYQGGSLNFDA